MLFWREIIVLAALSLTALAACAQESKRAQRGARMIDALHVQARSAATAGERERIEQLIAEVQAALDNNAQPPVRERIDVFQLPFVHYQYARAKVGSGTAPATNLRDTNAADLSVVDPLPSTFWSRPTNIAGQNMSAGFGREAAPRFADRIWTYAAPKTGYGGHAGFEAEGDGVIIKLKFGEIHSEPFTARIFHALGYNVEPTDFSPSLKIHYDRRLFTEFNSRKPVNTKLTAFGVLPVWTIKFQPEHDPFRFIVAGVTKEGSRLSPDELRRRVGRDDAALHYVITAPANVQVKDAHMKNIGPWDQGQLGHEHLRELRGAGLLAAWLGWFDSRFENTRLKAGEGVRSPELKHYFSDLGGGLRARHTWLGFTSDAADAFPVFFTRPEMRQGRGRMTRPFRIVSFRPIEPTPAFAAMTRDDARWMARLIAELADEQIAAALAASGFGEKERSILAKKLFARRDRMLTDLDLSR
jgi:hypothetical protein